MLVKSMAVGIGMTLGAMAITLPANAATTSYGYRVDGVPTAWSRMTHRSRMRGHRVSRKGAGTASPSAPNSTRGRIGPTGQPTGVK